MPIMPKPQPTLPKSTFIGQIDDPTDAPDCPRVQLDYAIMEKSPLGLDHKKSPKRNTNVCCPASPYQSQAAKPQVSKLPLSPPQALPNRQSIGILQLLPLPCPVLIALSSLTDSISNLLSTSGLYLANDSGAKRHIRTNRRMKGRSEEVV